MRIVIQRVSNASVFDSKIERGLFVLLGIHKEDTKKNVDNLVEKLVKLRIMADKERKMNLSIQDAGGSVLLVSQFTLYADTKKGNRPSFIKAARPDKAKPLYNYFVQSLMEKGIYVQTGRFGEYMDIKADLDGPVTIIIDD